MDGAPSKSYSDVQISVKIILAILVHDFESKYAHLDSAKNQNRRMKYVKKVTF